VFSLNLWTTGEVARRSDAALAPRLLKGRLSMPAPHADDPLRTTDHPPAFLPGQATGTYHPNPDAAQRDASRTASARPPAIPGYEILGELGRGGMGVGVPQLPAGRWKGQGQDLLGGAAGTVRAGT